MISRFLPAFLIEVDPPRLAEASSSPSELKRYFSELGYRGFISERMRLRKVSLELLPELVNVICLHCERHATQIARAPVMR